MKERQHTPHSQTIKSTKVQLHFQLFLAILSIMTTSNCISWKCQICIACTKESTLTMYYQDIFCAVSANGIFCFTSVCAIVCFVQEADAQNPAIDNHSLWIWQFSTVLCPQYWFWPVGSKQGIYLDTWNTYMHMYIRNSSTRNL